MWEDKFRGLSTEAIEKIMAASRNEPRFAEALLNLYKQGSFPAEAYADKEPTTATEVRERLYDHKYGNWSPQEVWQHITLVSPSGAPCYISISNEGIVRVRANGIIPVTAQLTRPGPGDNNTVTTINLEKDK